MVKRRLRRLWDLSRSTLTLVLACLLLTGSTIHARDTAEYVRKFTRAREFSFSHWTMGALRLKLGQFALGATGYLSGVDGQTAVRTYIDLVAEASDQEVRLEQMMSDPNGIFPPATIRALSEEVTRIRQLQNVFQPVAETILQEQAAMVLSEMGLGLGGEPFPPLAFHFTQPPAALIISPRDVIRQDGNISLDPEISLEERVALERNVEREMDVSALVVSIGGIGIYPTMVQESTSLTWISEVVVHEWVHNYLTLRPLGLLYNSSPELRTMNETTANLIGKEVGRKMLERYYPDLVPPPPAEDAQITSLDESSAFDFRGEMRETRVHVDDLLAEGKVEEAESYMEERRQIFWENGYRIRRLNQAYFAFHGAYADEPGGAAGDDPVGEAVRELWALMDSPAEFLRMMSWMNDYADLQAALASWQGGR
jgi:hypothetical protein